MENLLSRKEFRASVLARDYGRCVICGDDYNIVAHHILERKLWPDGGYYLDNGASLCEDCHIEAEQTIITPEELRAGCKITKVILPPHMYSDQEYDKWGNIILANGQKIIGELFFDDSVQKILKSGSVLSDFTHWVKYPRTYHLPWSPGLHDDDKMMPNLNGFADQEVVVTEKLDGENTSLYCNHIHARSVNSRNHPSRNWVKNFWSKMRHDIPLRWRVCGENMFAKHSISYNELPSYFIGFSIWNEKNECLNWDDTLEWFELLGVTPVPILSKGTFNQSTITDVGSEYLGDCSRKEGYVVRITDSFRMSNFKNVVGKYVRPNHIMTTKHWMHGQRIVRNGLVGK